MQDLLEHIKGSVVGGWALLEADAVSAGEGDDDFKTNAAGSDMGTVFMVV